MSHRVLIVSPHFPPINAPDHQRIRISLPYFQEFGWEPHILTVHPDYIEGVHDPLLEQTVPSNITVTRTGALPIEYTRRVGLGNLGLRCLPYLLRAGNQILAQEKFTLVYFSTTMFPVMALGPRWCSRFGIPYVLDFQDPWLSDYSYGSGSKPPGGQLKYGFSQFIARVIEPLAMRHVSHAISVSPEYPKTLLRRYLWLREEQFTVLPFGAAKQDFELLPTLNVQQKIFELNDGKQHWVYVGRGGGDMAFALRSLFQALARVREQEPQKFSNLMLHFIGTDYAPEDRARKTIEPIAVECGVDDIVQEHTQRIPYFEALQCLLDADALIVPGSDDPSYTASKIYPYILAKKPLLAIFHEKSSVVNVLESTKAGTVVTFATGDDTIKVSQAIETNWLQSIPPLKPVTDWEAFMPYTAREMTRRQCTVFEQCLLSTNKPISAKFADSARDS